MAKPPPNLFGGNLSPSGRPVDPPPYSSMGQPADPPPEMIVRLALVQSACMAVMDAAAHVRRTSILAEAASTAALVRVLEGKDDDRSWVPVMEGAQVMMTAASEAFVEAARSAMVIAQDKGRAPPTAP